jgi:acyl-coenzyme A thioesterase 9
LPETEEEIKLFQKLQQRNETRKLKRKQDAAKKTHNTLFTWPSPASVLLAKHLLREGHNISDMPALVNPNLMLIDQTRLSNALMCQPQQRNTRGRIFGGFLMRRAFEIAFTTAYMFLGQQPLFREVDRVEFKSPVEVGNLLQLSSCVLYTSNHAQGIDQDYNRLLNPDYDNTSVSFVGGPKIHVEVLACVTRPEEGTSSVSNTFHFTFESRDPNRLLRRVVPNSAEQAHSVVTQIEINAQQEEQDALGI